MFETFRAWQRRTFPMFNNDQVRVKSREPKKRRVMETISPVFREQSIFEHTPEELARREAARLEREAERQREREIRNMFPRDWYLDWEKMEMMKRGEGEHLLRLAKRGLESPTVLTLKHFFMPDKMELTEGHDEILDRLARLKIGQVALIRFKMGMNSGYRFRRWTKEENGKCTVQNRDSHGYIQVGTNSWSESCFSEWDYGIDYNIMKMKNHDGSHFKAEQMIIFEYDHDVEHNARLYLQDELYTHERLEFEGCDNFKEMKKTGELYAKADHSPWTAPKLPESEPVHSNAYWDIPF